MISVMGRVTLADVASRAGVSRATASLVLRGAGRLAPETRERVLATMDELGYVYHRGAASLRTQRSHTVGVLVTDLSNPSFTKLTLELEAELSTAGYMTMLTNTFDDAEREFSLLRTFLERSVDALIRVPAASETKATQALLAATDIPILAITRQPPDAHSYLGPNNHHGGRLAAQHLASVHGCRRIAYLGGPANGEARRHRLKAVTRAIETLPGGAVVLDVPGDTSAQDARRIASALLDSGADFDAAICHSDLVAYAVLSAWKSSGHDQPLPVVGFDNIATSEFFDPAVTSVAVDGLGRHAAARILEMISGGPESVQLLTPSLVVRSSCGCHSTMT